MDLPDPVPLGVSGALTLPRARYQALAGQGQPEILADDPARLAYLARRLDVAIGRPLIGQGSDALVRAVLGLFPKPEIIVIAFAEKALESLRDGAHHDRMVVPEDGPRAIIWFHAWNGTHREVQPLRYGDYLSGLFGGAFRMIERVGPLIGFLQIDAFVREDVDPGHPARPLDQTFAIDVEFSFMPGPMLRYPPDAPNPLPNIALFNRSLCTDQELQALDKLNS